VVTGAASGMGRAVVTQLEHLGHQVIGVDLRDTDVVADLSTPSGRDTAVRQVLELCDGVLDGAVLAAGLGPTPGRGRPLLIGQVNVLGVTELLTGWREALAVEGGGKAVVFASNSTTTVPLVPRRVIRAFLAGDVERGARSLRLFGRAAPALAYAASKIAVSHWVRATAVRRDWAGAGIRLNALAPGAILTPLLEKQLATPAEAKQIRSFPVPVGGFGDPEHLAAWAVFMLADTADFLCGSVLFVDGGSDAWFRATDWPRPYPARRMATYLQRMRRVGPTL
jgi:NAD(P)-dependent dehydrogenase (short-subunit alcohol dehydrogenase family)